MANSHASLKAALFGGVAVSDAAGNHLRLASAKGIALLGFLLVNAPRLQSRDRICDLLWVESPLPQARASLRQTLTRLRRSLGSAADAIVIDGDAVGIDLHHIEADACEFQSLLSTNCQDGREQALARYTGTLMDGFHVDEPPFEDWLATEQQRFLDLALSCGRELLRDHRDNAQADKAVRVARHLLSLDPLQEDIHHQLIELLMENGRADLAKTQLERLRKLLTEELGVNVSRATEDLLDTGMPTGPVPDDTHAKLRDLVVRALEHLRSAASRAHGQGRHREAATLYRQALNLAHDAGQPAPEFELSLRAGLQREHFVMRNFDACLTELKHMTRLARESGDDAAVVRCYLSEAQVLRTLGQLQPATALARRALGGARTAHSEALEALANLRLASLHFRAGAYLKALPLLITNVEVLGAPLRGMHDEAEPGNPAVRSHSWLAWTSAELGRVTDAERYARQGLELADEVGEHYSRIHARIALGVVYFRSERMAEARQTLLEALGLSERTDLLLLAPYIIPPLACTFAHAGDTAAARNYIDEFEFARDSGVVLATLADAERMSGRELVSRQLAERAVDASRQSGANGDLGWSLYALGAACRAAGADTDSDDALREARTIAAELRMLPLARACDAVHPAAAPGLTGEQR